MTGLGTEVDTAVALIKLEPGGRQGSMKPKRRIVTSVGVVALVAACLPVGAQANPLLSGYGGPGQGNQSILGASLLNGRGGGGGGSGTLAVAAANGSGSDESASGTVATPAGAHPNKQSGASARGHAGAQRRSPRHPLDVEGAYRALERTASVSGDGALGLSGSQIALIAVVMALLAMIGVVTWRVARPWPAKGHG